MQERSSPGYQEDKDDIRTSLLKVVSDFLVNNSQVTVSEAQMQAFRRTLDAIPDGKFKELVGRFEKIQIVSSKINEVVTRGYDGTWRIAEPFVVQSAPFIVVIPKDPFSKLAIKGLSVGGYLAENVIKATVKGTETIKNQIQKAKKKS